MCSDTKEYPCIETLRVLQGTNPMVYIHIPLGYIGCGQPEALPPPFKNPLF